MRVPAAIGDFLVICAVRESGGTAVTVSDEEMVDGMVEMARMEGVFAAPEGGATLAAMRKLIDSGLISRDERVVLLDRDAHKYLDMLPAGMI